MCIRDRVVAACVIPNIGPEVATKFNAAGEATRWGKSYELLALPVLNLLLLSLIHIWRIFEGHSPARDM